MTRLEEIAKRHAGAGKGTYSDFGTNAWADIGYLLTELERLVEVTRNFQARKCWCGHAISRHDPEDGTCDAPNVNSVTRGVCGCGRQDAEVDHLEARLAKADAVCVLLKAFRDVQKEPPLNLNEHARLSAAVDKAVKAWSPGYEES